MTDYTNWTTEQREGEPMNEWETVTVRADQIKEGDRYKGVEVMRSEPRRDSAMGDWYFSTTTPVDGTFRHARCCDELVEVERPITTKTVTISVELTEDEADYASETWWGLEGDCLNTLRMKIAEAVRKAQTP